MAMNNVNLDLAVEIYSKVTTIGGNDLDVDRLTDYLAILTEQIQDQQATIYRLEAKLSRCEDEISELNRDNYDYQLR
jgi:predicted RNase H-like nuclease (RuvC/YqgF family)